MKCFVTLRLRSTGQVLRHECASRLDRALLLIALRLSADVIEMGES